MGAPSAHGSAYKAVASGSQGALQVECSTIVSFTKTSGQYEDLSLIAHGGSAHGPRIVMLGGCVNKAIGLFVTDIR